MQLSLSANSLLLWGLLMGACSAAPAGADVTLPNNLPPTCIKFDNGALVTPSCYTATATASPTNCPKTRCLIPTEDIVCPEIIRVTTVTVPCSTDCCPHTPTKTVTGTCRSCGCVIPTETITATTGCRVNPGGPIITYPLPTAALISG